ncbi:MAG: TrbC/VirB2 family protein [Gammaproteobacteria bacterium]
MISSYLRVPRARFSAQVLTLSAVALVLPQLACAQASPFQTGADSLVTNLIALATPIAILAIMALAVVAMTGRISWGWPIGALIGVGVIFGAPQIVTWARGLFGV